MNVYLSAHLNAYISTLHYDQKSKWKGKERSGILKVAKVGTDLFAYDIFHPKQKNSSGWTEFPEGMMDELVQKVGFKEVGKFGIWLHSHHSMQAFRSWQDFRQRKEFAEWGTDFFVSVVTSSKSWSSQIGDNYFHATLDVFKPEFETDIGVYLWHPQMQIEIDTFREEMLADMQKEIDAEKEKYDILMDTYGISQEAFDKFMANKISRIESTFNDLIEEKRYELAWAWEIDNGFYFDEDERFKELVDAEIQFTYTPDKSIKNYNSRFKGSGAWHVLVRENPLDLEFDEDQPSGYATPKLSNYYQPHVDGEGNNTLNANETQYKTKGWSWEPIKFLKEWYLQNSGI